MRRRSKIKLVLALVMIAGLAAFLWRPIRQAWHVAALQACVENSSWVTVSTEERPPAMPAWLDTMAMRVCHSLARQGIYADGRVPLTRFRALFQGPIDYVNLQGPFTGDVNAVLPRFPQLQTIIVSDMPGDRSTPGTVFLSSSEWSGIIAGLHACPRIEVLSLVGENLDDTALAPLARHPTLKEVYLSSDQLTPACTATFATMPRLSVLMIWNRAPVNSLALSPEDLPALQAALPGVQVKLTSEPALPVSHPFGGPSPSPPVPAAEPYYGKDPFAPAPAGSKP